MKIFRRTAAMILKKFRLSNSAEIIKKQMLLNPAAGGRKEAEKYRIEKLSEVLKVLFFGGLLSAAVAVSSLTASCDTDDFRIARNGYGGGDRTVELSAKVGDREIREPISLTVGERQFTEEETEKIFDEIGGDLPGKILGENGSLERVEYDLVLKETADEYPVNIEWSTDNYDVIDSSGTIQEEVKDENGTPVVLTATLSYLGRYSDYSFPVLVFPRHKDAAGRLRDLVINKIGRYDALTVSAENLVLPHSIGDSEISYQLLAGKNGSLILLITVISAFIIWYGRDRDLDKKIKEREKEMLLDYPDIVSRLNLFFCAGMTIRGAFERIAADYEKQRKNNKKEKRYAFEEMLITVREMKGGVPESQAYQNFGSRAGVRRYGKLGTLLSQNLRKGNAGLTAALEAEARDAFEDRKANAKRTGEEAGTKLLLPMGIMLLVVMIIVIIPAFLSFSL
ncbi:MAG: type II secretion system F family protein [Lachnospiraceae bacterium]|nr:type II secretion system F family protein [Lachnospiraceae bacterium]